MDFIDPAKLTPKGKKKLKKILESADPDYHSIGAIDFKDSFDYYHGYRNSLAVHDTLKEIFRGAYDSDQDADDGLDYSTKAVFENLASMILDLRQQINSVEEMAYEANRRLDNA